jgi:hypothetical protein
MIPVRSSNLSVQLLLYVTLLEISGYSDVLYVTFVSPSRLMQDCYLNYSTSASLLIFSISFYTHLQTLHFLPQEFLSK